MKTTKQIEQEENIKAALADHAGIEWDAMQDDPRRPRSQATVLPETLTDGSIVYNVWYEGRQVANPATQAQAEEIAEGFNTGIHFW